MTGLLPDRAGARLWLDRIWDDQEGWAATAIGREPRLSASGRYAHGSFAGRFFCWPEDREQLVGDLLACSDTCDIFVAPLLRDHPSRAQGRSRPLAGRYAWLDADGWDGDRQSKLESSGSTVWRVATGGGPANFHIYVDLEELLPGAAVAEYSRRLASAFGTDTYGGDNKLLRLPGTYNHKPRAAGGRPGLVRWVA